MHPSRFTSHFTGTNALGRSKRKEDIVSSSIYHIDFRPSHTRMLRKMLKKAGYVSSNMKPIEGPQYEASKSLLIRFRSGIMAYEARE